MTSLVMYISGFITGAVAGHCFYLGYIEIKEAIEESGKHD